MEITCNDKYNRPCDHHDKIQLTIVEDEEIISVCLLVDRSQVGYLVVFVVEAHQVRMFLSRWAS